MLPRSIKVGAHNYQIKSATAKELGRDGAADVNNVANLIRISSRATRSRKIELLLHECIHAMLAGHEFKDEETIVVILGEALTRFLADNPRFVIESLKVLLDPKKFKKIVDKVSDRA